MAFSWRRGASVLGGATLLYGMAEMWRVVVREYDIALANLPPAAEGMRLLQISDLHYGLLMPRALLRRIVHLAAAQNADAIVLTGDMVSRRNSYPPLLHLLAPPITDYARGLAAELKVLQPAQGVWAVPGNHDLWEGSFAPVGAALAEANVETLLNRSVRFPNGLALVGVDDLRAGSPDLQAAFEGVDPEIGHVILSHNPRLTLLLREREALVLSGHTHAGQIRIPPLPANSPVDSSETLWQGGFFPVGRSQLYVSAGTGVVGIPVRLNVPPEIVVFTLRHKAAS